MKTLPPCAAGQYERACPLLPGSNSTCTGLPCAIHSAAWHLVLSANRSLCSGETRSQCVGLSGDKTHRYVELTTNKCQTAHMHIVQGQYNLPKNVGSGKGSFDVFFLQPVPPPSKSSFGVDCVSRSAMVLF